MGAERFGPMDSGSAREPALPLVEIHGPQAPGEGDKSYLRWEAFRPTAASGRRGNDKMGGRRKLDSILFLWTPGDKKLLDGFRPERPSGFRKSSKLFEAARPPYSRGGKGP